MKFLKILISLIVIIFITLILANRHNKLAEERKGLKENSSNLAHNNRILKKEYERELKERLRLKNKYDLIKDEKESLKERESESKARGESLQRELDRKDRERDALMAEVKDISEENKNLKDKITFLTEDYIKQLEAGVKEKAKLEKEKLELEDKIKALEGDI